jgi:hypothetical protein
VKKKKRRRRRRRRRRRKAVPIEQRELKDCQCEKASSQRRRKIV